MKSFSRDTIPSIFEMKEYRKIGTTKMERMNGPFEVETTEGTLVCKDGWLAIDSEGNPYPIDDIVQTKTYELAE